MTVGERIRSARKLAGLSQKELAERLGMNPVMISQYENGTRNPKYETIQRIASALGVNSEYISGGQLFFSFEEPPQKVSDDDIRFALWGGDADIIDDSVMEEVKNFAKYIAERKKAKSAKESNTDEPNGKK